MSGRLLAPNRLNVDPRLRVVFVAASRWDAPPFGSFANIHQETISISRIHGDGEAYPLSIRPKADAEDLKDLDPAVSRQSEERNLLLIGDTHGYGVSIADLFDSELVRQVLDGSDFNVIS
jgi:hypothetical protein